MREFRYIIDLNILEAPFAVLLFKLHFPKLSLKIDIACTRKRTGKTAHEESDRYQILTLYEPVTRLSPAIYSCGLFVACTTLFQ